MPARLVTQLAAFAWHEAASCLFAAGIFACLGLSKLVTTPLPRYDLMLLCCLLFTAVLWASGMESTREVLIIGTFHLAGLALELYKVRAGSWSYPEPAYTKIAGVPLYGGFMYAAVGSYIVHAWRRFDLRLHGHRQAPLAVLSIAIYANFYTHHFVPDARWVLAVLVVWVCRRSWVTFRVRDARYRMPLAVSFVLIGFFLWLAENIATYLGAWRYPYQEGGWEPVHVAKLGAWSLLVTLSFSLVAMLRATPGRGSRRAGSGTSRQGSPPSAASLPRSVPGPSGWRARR